MSIVKSRRIILPILGWIVLVVGWYLGFQFIKVQHIADQFALDAQKLAQGSGNVSGSANIQAQGSNDMTSAVLPDQTSTTSSSGIPASKDYKQLMSKTYQQTLQEMQNLKINTLALQGGKISLYSYNASVVQSQAIFSSAEAFVRANPPTDANLTASYQEFLEGISLANQAMGVVLKGIFYLDESKFYAAREMGKTAQQQVENGYSHL